MSRVDDGPRVDAGSRLDSVSRVNRLDRVNQATSIPSQTDPQAAGLRDREAGARRAAMSYGSSR